MTPRGVAALAFVLVAVGATAWWLFFPHGGRPSAGAWGDDPEAVAPRPLVGAPAPSSATREEPLLAPVEAVEPEPPPPPSPEAMTAFQEADVDDPVGHMRLPRPVGLDVSWDGGDVWKAIVSIPRLKVRWQSRQARAAFLGSRISFSGFVSREPPIDHVTPEEVMAASRAAGFDARWSPPVLWFGLAPR